MIGLSTFQSVVIRHALPADISVGGFDLLWGAPGLLPIAIAVVVVLAVIIVWAYLAPLARGPVRFAAALLKLSAIVLLAICLLEPLRSGTRPRPQANVLPILVDNSQSMRLKAGTRDESRHDQVLETLQTDSGWRTRLSQDFDVRQYGFDARLENVDDFATLKADGYVSSLATSLESLSRRFVDRPVAGVLLFTDGNLTDLSRRTDWSNLGFPIYPVVPADDDTMRDLRIKDITVRQTDFESAPITVGVTIDAVGMAGDEVTVQLRDSQSGKRVQEEKVSINKDGEAHDVRFRFRPEESGVRFYRAVVFTEADRERIASGDESGVSKTEATLLNNSRLVTITRDRGPYRILYIAGRPNWEYKFLRRALQEDAEVQLVGLLRIARKEPKFSFRDKGVSDTNPLFAGLGESEEEAAEQYDEPVIIRLGVKESEELSDGFPESAEELFAYHGVILDDIESEFFTQDQMLLLRRFVGSRGGGLLMLGGQESFGDTSFGETPLGELSPVYAPRRSDATTSGPFAMKLTREGLLQPWVRLRDNESAEQTRLAQMPPFRILNFVGDVKPGASQLATVDGASDDRSYPALVAQRFGKGRSAAMLVGDLWRWSMRRDENQKDDPAQAWRQIAHWLVNDVPRRAELRVENSKDPSQPVTIVANARDQAYMPMDNAKVELTITPLGEKPFTISASMDPQQPGVYRATYWSREPGGYHVRAKITAADGSDVGKAEAGWTAQSGAAEFRDLRVNRGLLQTIAADTGGQLITSDQLDQFASDLRYRDVPVTERWVYPVWHRPWVLFAAIACLCGEWGLRRLKGLA